MLLKTPIAVFVGIAALSYCAGDASGQGKGKRKTAPAGQHGWLSSLQAGKTAALKTGKPMMVVLRCVP